MPGLRQIWQLTVESQAGLMSTSLLRQCKRSQCCKLHSEQCLQLLQARPFLIAGELLQMTPALPDARLSQPSCGLVGRSDRLQQQVQQSCRRCVS